MIEHQGHTQQVIVARGLPGSGKTTYFKTLRQNMPCARYISRDDLRFMLVGAMWNPRREKAVTDARDTLLRRFLTEGHCVILDETFLNPKVLRHVRAIVTEYSSERGEPLYPNVGVNEKDFTDVDVDVCVERDINRGDRAVGAGVIRGLAQKWLRAPAPAKKPGVPDAILCDLDGTLALFGDANPYDRPFENDIPNEAVARILTRMATNNVRIIITSGRKEEYRDVTRKWLDENFIPYDGLLMRPPDKPDLKDAHLKRQWYNDAIRDYYNVLFVLDDRDQVVDMWRLLGLVCLQVDYGAF